MEPQSERRIERRNRTFKGGRIVYNRGFTAIDCTVRNLSDKGALLETAEPVGLPRELVLYVNPDRAGRPCRLVWHEGRRLGVEFTATATDFAAQPASRSLPKSE